MITIDRNTTMSSQNKTFRTIVLVKAGALEIVKQNPEVTNVHVIVDDEDGNTFATMTAPQEFLEKDDNILRFELDRKLHSC